MQQTNKTTSNFAPEVMEQTIVIETNLLRYVTSSAVQKRIYGIETH